MLNSDDASKQHVHVGCREGGSRCIENVIVTETTQSLGHVPESCWRMGTNQHAEGTDRQAHHCKYCTKASIFLKAIKEKKYHSKQVLWGDKTPSI